ncbi:MAG: hypothetical protein WC850_04135 [Candidatus Gracilibacteria bacterium]
MTEYLKVSENLGLDKIETGEKIEVKLESDANSIITSDNINANLKQIVENLNLRNKTKAGIKGYFSNGGIDIKELALKYDGQIKEELSKFTEGGQKDVDGLLMSINTLVEKSKEPLKSDNVFASVYNHRLENENALKQTL